MIELGCRAKLKLEFDYGAIDGSLGEGD